MDGLVSYLVYLMNSLLLHLLGIFCTFRGGCIDWLIDGLIGLLSPR